MVFLYLNNNFVKVTTVFKASVLDLICIIVFKILLIKKKKLNFVLLEVLAIAILV